MASRGAKGCGPATTDGAAVKTGFSGEPGGWGKFAGLEVRRDSVELLKSMGVTAIRQGGSFTDPEYYFWKRGPGGALRCLVCVCACVLGRHAVHSRLKSWPVPATAFAAAVYGSGPHPASDS